MRHGKDFSIVTPSHNMLEYLPRCAASVNDQAGVTSEHLVMDAVSTDGTAEWLRQRTEIRSVIEPDRGMYDAVNKGFALAEGRYVAYLNCDEQYLPGTLSFVRGYFERHPECDLLFGDMLLVRPDGNLVSYRKGYTPRWPYIMASHLYVFTCTMFLRRRIIEDGFRFDPNWRAVGDMEYVLRLLRHGYRAHHVKRYLGAFVLRENNLGAGADAAAELRQLQGSAPLWIRLLKHPINGLRLFEKFLSGAYCQRMPLEYALYGPDVSGGRMVFSAQEASFQWRTA